MKTITKTNKDLPKLFVNIMPKFSQKVKMKHGSRFWTNMRVYTFKQALTCVTCAITSFYFCQLFIYRNIFYLQFSTGVCVINLYFSLYNFHNSNITGFVSFSDESGPGFEKIGTWIFVLRQPLLNFEGKKIYAEYAHI